MTKQTSDFKNKVILAVGAHPDDMDFGASGTIARMVDEGAKAYYLICTDGSRGSSDPTMTHERLSKIREREQRAAAKVLGLTDVFFLDHPDTMLTVTHDLKEEIVRLIRTLKPDIVITMDPTFHFSKQFALFGASFVNHSDHRAAALATMDAVFPLARDRLTFHKHEKEGLLPHKVAELWMTAFEEVDYMMDISKTFEKKLTALKEHKSQFENWKETEERVTKRAEYFGKKLKVKYAENFVRLLIP